MADTHPDFLQRPLRDGVVPAEQVARTEKRWLSVMVGMLIVMMVIVVLTEVQAVAAFYGVRGRQLAATN